MDDVEEVIEHTKHEEITFTLVRALFPYTKTSQECNASLCGPSDGSPQIAILIKARPCFMGPLGAWDQAALHVDEISHVGVTAVVSLRLISMRSYLQPAGIHKC